MLTETLWYIDPQLDKLRDRSIRLLDLLANLHSYRDLKRQHKKIPELKVDELEQHCNNLGEILSSPWFMKKQYAVFREAITDLHDSLQKYVDYLCKRKENASDRIDSQEPVRGFKDNWSLEEIGGDPSVQPSDEYASLFKTLQDRDVYNRNPVYLQELEPKSIKNRQKGYASLKMLFPIAKFVYKFGNNLGNLTVVWKVPPNSQESDKTQDIRIINEVRANLPVYSTRAMRRDFINLYAPSTHLKSAHLRNIYQVLTGHVYSPKNAEQHVVDDRLCDFLLRSDDPDLVHDLCANNGKLINPDLNPFWTALQNILDEESATHERRQSSTCFLPFAISVEDLREKVLARLPVGTPASRVIAFMDLFTVSTVQSSHKSCYELHW